MSSYTVTITGQYVIEEAESPKQAAEEALRRSNHPDVLEVEVHDA